MRTLGLTPLSERRAKIKLVMIHKIRSNEIEIASDDLCPTNCHRFPLNYQRTHSTVDSHLLSKHYMLVELCSYSNQIQLHSDWFQEILGYHYH